MRSGKKAGVAKAARPGTVDPRRLYELVCVAVGRHRDGIDSGVRFPRRRGLQSLADLGAKLARRFARAD